MIGSLSAAGKIVSESRRGQGRKVAKAVALSLAAGVVLGGQVPAQAAPGIGQLPDITARESTIDYQNSETVDKIGGDLVDVMGGVSRVTSGGESGHITEPFAPGARQLRKEFGAMGSHPVAATREAMPCDGVVYTIYNRVLRDLYGLHDTTGCYDVLPESVNASPVGAQLIHPTDIDSMESAPLMVLSLVAIAEYEDIVPLDADRRAYRDAAGPAWEAVVTGSYHGTYLDDPSKNVLGSLVMSFSEYVLDGTNRAKAVCEGANYGLATDSELKDVQRKGV